MTQYFKIKRTDGTKLKQRIGKHYPEIPDSEIGKDILATFELKKGGIMLKIPSRIVKIKKQFSNNKIIYLEELDARDC